MQRVVWFLLSPEVCMVFLVLAQVVGSSPPALNMPATRYRGTEWGQVVGWRCGGSPVVGLARHLARTRFPRVPLLVKRVPAS